MNEQMAAWKKDDAREHDQKSVWQMLAIRNSADPCPKICDSRWLFLTRNTALVNIANKAWKTWLKGATSHSTSHIDRWAPVAMSDKQFAGYLWTRTGGGLGASIPKARLLAHCSAAVKPRADVKAKAYNLVLEFQGKVEADYFAALMEDREAAGALMRATRGDPEDVTMQRLPFIMDEMKRAAGEYAADKVRKEAEAEKETLKSAYEAELQRAMRDSAANALSSAKAQHDIELQAKDARARDLAEAVRQHEEADRTRKGRVLRDGFNRGKLVFRILRWFFVGLLGLGSAAATLLASSSPMWSLSIGTAVAVAGAWFVPDLLNRPLGWVAMNVMRAYIEKRESGLQLPAEPVDFRADQWPVSPANDVLRTEGSQA